MHGRGVLIIESDRELAIAIARMFLREGYQIHIAQSGQAGIQVAKLVKPVLTILEFRPFEVNAFQVLDVLRQTSKQGIVVLGEEGEIESVAGILHAGADDYLYKPVIDMRELFFRARNIMRRYHEQKSTAQAGVH